MMQLGSERNDRPADVFIPDDQPQVFLQNLVQEIPTFNPDALPRASESPPLSLLAASSSDKDIGIADIGKLMKKSAKETIENGNQNIGHLGKKLLYVNKGGITSFCCSSVEWLILQSFYELDFFPVSLIDGPRSLLRQNYQVK